MVMLTMFMDGGKQHRRNDAMAVDGDCQVGGGDAGKYDGVMLVLLGPVMMMTMLKSMSHIPSPYESSHIFASPFLSIASICLPPPPRLRKAQG